MTKYLTVADVLAIHQDQIDWYGGAGGVRDYGLLEAAVFRPQSGYYADLVEESAALWESLSQNHPFFDGNKRTAFDAMQTFLTVNGLHLKVDVHEACDFVLDLYATHQFQFDNLVPWLRENVAPH